MRNRLIRVTVLALVMASFTIALSATPAQAAGCQGAPPEEPNAGSYPEARRFMESQGWWVPDGEAGDNAGHIHIAMCYPLNKQVSGVVDFQLRIMMHDNPGTVFAIHSEICSGDAQTSCTNVGTDIDPQMTCPGAGATCEDWFAKSVDTNEYPNDGRAFIRIEARTEQPNNSLLKTSQNWPVQISNGNPLLNGDNTIQGKGWYKPTNSTPGKYSFATFPQGGASWPFSVTSGSVSYVIKCGGGDPISECLVTVDPLFHMDDDGSVQATFSDGNSHTVTTNLNNFSPGIHFLVIRSKSALSVSADCPTPFCPATRAGLIRVPFKVTAP
jgi:hypothetical protein